MRAGKHVEAVSLLALNQKAHPSSSMAAADLADAELANGDKPSALENYRLAIRLDGSNSHAHEQVNALSKKQNSHSRERYMAESGKYSLGLKCLIYANFPSEH